MNQKKGKKIYLFGIPSVICLVAVGFIALQMTHTTHFFQNTADTSKQQETALNSKKKTATIEGKGNPSTTDATGNPVVNNGTYTPPSNNADITITPSTKNNQVVISTKLAGYSDGSCSVTVTNGSQTTTQSANVIYAPDFSTCAGFTIPVTTLGTGTWNISLTITSGGISTTKAMTYVVES